MKNWQTILSLARLSLIVFASALASGIALYAASLFFKDKMQVELSQVQQTQSSTQASLAEKQIDLGNLQAKIERFNLLRQQGLVGSADREGWVEQLVASQQRTGLPNTLAYTLQAPKPMTTQGEAVSAAPAAADAVPGAATGPQFYDLDIELGSIHEEELLALLRDYQAQVKGRFRVNACTLSGRTETGLSAHCTLRFFTLSDEKPKPNPP